VGILIGSGGGSSISHPGTPPPHGGVLLEMPDGKGYIEVVKKPVGDKETSVVSEVTFYLLRDMSTPFSPAPTTGTLTVQ